ncbi:unnamed protein product [Chrysoparadoxa australica]
MKRIIQCIGLLGLLASSGSVIVDHSHSYLGSSGTALEAILSSLATQPDGGALELMLEECALGDDGVAAVAGSQKVTGAQGVTVLSFRHNGMGAKGAKEVLQALRQAEGSRVGSLVLDFNPIGDSGVQPMPALLKEAGTSLRTLSLAWCGIGVKGCRSIASALIKGELVAREGAGGTLATLRLNGNRVGDAGARSLATALRKNCSLQELDLTHCSLGDEAAMHLADALQTNTNLRVLRLGYNKITAEGAAALASLIEGKGKGRCHLTHLELSNNRLGDDGARAIAFGLKGQRVKASGSEGDASESRGQLLDSLGLANNGIGCAGAAAIASVLGTKKCHLKHLNLSGNKITLSSVGADAGKITKTAAGALSSLGKIYNSLVDEGLQVDTQELKAKGFGGIVSSVVGASSGSSGSAVPMQCGLQCLGRALRRNSALLTLGLAGTGITTGDAGPLVLALRANTSLQSIDCGINRGLSPAAASAIRRAVGAPGADEGELEDAKDSEGDGEVHDEEEMWGEVATFDGKEEREAELDTVEFEMVRIQRRAGRQVGKVKSRVTNVEGRLRATIETEVEAPSWEESEEGPTIMVESSEDKGEGEGSDGWGQQGGGGRGGAWSSSEEEDYDSVYDEDAMLEENSADQDEGWGEGDKGASSGDDDDIW